MRSGYSEAADPAWRVMWLEVIGSYRLGATVREVEVRCSRGLRQVPELIAWIKGLGGKLVIANYIYLDGEANNNYNKPFSRQTTIIITIFTPRRATPRHVTSRHVTSRHVTHQSRHMCGRHLPWTRSLRPSRVHCLRLLSRAPGLYSYGLYVYGIPIHNVWTHAYTHMCTHAYAHVCSDACMQARGQVYTNV